MLYETGQLLRDNLVQEWEKIGSTEIVQTIAQSLLNILLNSNELPYSVTKKLAGVIALVVKHQFATQNGPQRAQLVGHLQAVMSSGGRALVSTGTG